MFECNEKSPSICWDGRCVGGNNATLIAFAYLLTLIFKAKCFPAIPVLVASGSAILGAHQKPTNQTDKLTERSKLQPAKWLKLKPQANIKNRLR